MLLNFDDMSKKISDGKAYFLAGDEEVLKKLPKGNWVGGTIPYFMDTIGGITDRSLIQAIPAPADVEEFKIVFYDEKNLYKIPSEAYDNGFSFIIIPAMSNVHLEYAKNAPNYENIFFKTIIGWISGIHLSDLGKITPKVFNGLTGEATDAKAIVMHCKIKEGKIPEIGIINIFEQSDGDTIKFNQTSFSVSECEINGKKRKFCRLCN